MNDEFQWWLVLVGMGLGGGLVWLLLARLPRNDEDVEAAELKREAEWISAVVADRGGVAPSLLVEEILELHREYLAGPPIDAGEDEQEALDGLEPVPPDGDGPPDETRPPATPAVRVDASRDLADPAR